MDLAKTHRRLMKYNKMYASWHKNPLSTYWHWFFFIYFVYVVNVIVIGAYVEVSLLQVLATF